MKKTTLRHLVQIIFLLSFILGIYNSINWLPPLVVALSILMGPLYCSYVCPMGFLQDMMHKLAKKLKIKQHVLPSKVHLKLVYIRYIIFASVMFLSFQWIFILLGYDPRVNLIGIFDGKVISVMSYMVIAGFLLIGLFYQRPFCSYFCFEGAKYGLMGVLRTVRIKRHEDKCVDCGKCNQACPMHVDITGGTVVNSIQCIQCHECIESCPKNGALTYVSSIKVLKKEKLNTKVFRKQNLIVIPLIAVAFLLFGAGEMAFPEYTNTQAIIENEIIVAQNDAKGIKDGVYKGSAQGFKGMIGVEVTVADELISEVIVVSHNDDARWFNQANKYIPSEIIANQSTQVDTVSMATYSSTGIVNAVKDALGQTDFIELEEKSGKQRHH